MPNKNKPEKANIARSKTRLHARFTSFLYALSALLLLVWAEASAAATVTDFRLSESNGTTRLVFELSANVHHKLFMLKNPNRVVVDIKNTKLDALINGRGIKTRHLRGIRTGQRKKRDLRLVLDLASNAKAKSFVLSPSKGKGHRLVIDLQSSGSKNIARKKIKQYKASKRDFVVVIDPGHGGRDPGAIGRRGTKEKDVTLAIGKKLAAIVERQSGYKAILTRSTDRLIPLRKRVALARRHNADLFISIHADAIKNPSARGASVYALSTGGASSELAKMLAERENAADLVGGVSISDKDEQLASVLLDLSQSATIQTSLEFAEDILKHLAEVKKLHLHRKDVQTAGFAVLKAPDIPSVLIETAFISNPKEEKNLRNSKYQKKLAKAIMKGIKQYAKRKESRGLFAQTESYIIQRGDSLSEIAEGYRMDAGAIMAFNGLKNDRIKVGQVLLIPAFSS